MLSRRGVLGAPALALAPLAAHAVKNTGYAANMETYTDEKAATKLAAKPYGDPAGIRFGGSYSDPMHPGCGRQIKLAGSAVYISGGVLGLKEAGRLRSFTLFVTSAQRLNWRRDGLPRFIAVSAFSLIHLPICTGADEDGKPWRVKGQVGGSRLLIDFSPKGGPTDVIATWNGIGLVFPDGNVWTKK